MPNLSNEINLKSNRNRLIFQGFFLAVAVAVADTSSVLPLIVDYFGGGKIFIGILSSLIKGGAVIMQLWTAFKAQEKSIVIKSLRKVFVFRFFTWFSVGLSILIFADFNNFLILALISLFLFLFSFSAGVGVIYYQELMGKSFSKEYRGKVFSYRQISAGIAGILSGGISGVILEYFPKPESFSYLFLISGFIMAAGFIIFWNFKEIPKKETQKKEVNFASFLKNAVKLWKTDKSLRLQTAGRFLSYSLFLILPFIILKAKNDFGISGKTVGIIISAQMAGAVSGNFLWGKLSGNNRNKCIIILSFLLAAVSVSASLFAESINIFYVIYFLTGAAVDGFRLAYSNLILIISKPDKRPVYIAVHNNLSSLGLFFPVAGGIVYKLTGFNELAFLTLFILISGLILSFFLKKE